MHVTNEDHKLQTYKCSTNDFNSCEMSKTIDSHLQDVMTQQAITLWVLNYKIMSASLEWQWIWSKITILISNHYYPSCDLLFEKCSISVLLCRKKEQMLTINKVWICTTRCSINRVTNVGFKLKKKINKNNKWRLS